MFFSVAFALLAMPYLRRVSRRAAVALFASWQTTKSFATEVTENTEGFCEKLFSVTSVAKFFSVAFPSAGDALSLAECPAL